MAWQPPTPWANAPNGPTAQYPIYNSPNGNGSMTIQYYVGPGLSPADQKSVYDHQLEIGASATIDPIEYAPIGGGMNSMGVYDYLTTDY